MQYWRKKKIIIIDKASEITKKPLGEQDFDWDFTMNNLLHSTDTVEQAKVRAAMLDKIELFAKFMKGTGLSSDELLIYLCCNPQNINAVNAKIYLAEKLAANEKIMNNKEIMENDDLFGNEGIKKNPANLLFTTNSLKNAQAKEAVLDKLFSDERLYNNENIINNFTQIIKTINTSEDAKTKLAFIDKFLSDESLYNNENIKNNSAVLLCLNSEANMQKMTEIFRNNRWLKFEPDDALMLNDVLSFSEFNSIQEMSPQQKREFLSVILKNNSKLIGKGLSYVVKVLPYGESGYIKTIQQLSQSMNINLKPISSDDLKLFDKNLQSLNQTLKNTDLGNLEQINLQISQKDFIAQVNSLTASLTREEKQKVFDYFGFDIKNGVLTGYPNTAGKDMSLCNISDNNTINVINSLKPVVDNYTDNNFITIKDYPQLNRNLKDISKLMPEIFRQIDGSTVPVDTIKTLQKVVQNPEFETLSDNDKKILTLAVLLHNTDNTTASKSGSAFDGFFIGKKFGLSDNDAVKLYRIIENSDIITRFMNTTKKETAITSNFIINISSVDRADKFDLMAFNLKEGNTFKLARMLYSKKDIEGLTRHLDKLLETRIQQIKSSDFVLPQTSADVIMENAQTQNINGYSVKVAKASDIDNFYAFIHTPEAAFVSGKSSREMKFANFEAFKTLEDDKVICTSYVGNGQYGAANDVGFIFEVSPQHQYVAFGYDIGSMSKNIPDMIMEYYKDKGYESYHGGLKYEERTMVSDNIKKILDISDDEYIKRLDYIKEKAQGQTLTLDLIQQIDPDFADAYQQFLSRHNDYGETDKTALLRNNHWNEVLVSNPTITAIYTKKDVSSIPKEYLKKAQEENLPIVVLQ